MRNWKIYGAYAFAVIVLASVVFIQYRINKALRAEKDRYKSNTEALLSNVKTYQTRDSLNAAQIDAPDSLAEGQERLPASGYNRPK